MVLISMAIKKGHNILTILMSRFMKSTFVSTTKEDRTNTGILGYISRGHSHGQLVAMSGNLSECCLWEPAGKWTSYLPRWDCNIPFKFATLSSSPRDWEFPTKFTKLSPLPKPRYGCNVMVLTGICYPAFAFFRLGWVGANRAVPSVVSRQFREYLLESNREILLVFLISRKSIDVVDDVEVFRLDISKLLWVKVESLGDMMLFLEDECCMGLSASKVGSKGSCIYFTHHRVKDWWVFDMETSYITQTSGPNIEFTKSSMWD
ncbi:putative F-box protein [Abeliophyllum distichum]|uniref:F-box protein n=1 Tax=Abeliophyllum distichum TaxID=126358 RepID=A0ABD1RR87_9LAMI